MPQIAPQAGLLYHRALTVEVRDFVRAELGGGVYHNLCSTLPLGPDIQVTYLDVKLAALEVESGRKQRWGSRNQSQTETDNMLHRAITYYYAVLIIVPTLDLKIQIERMIGRRDHSITVMTIRELPPSSGNTIIIWLRKWKNQTDHIRRLLTFLDSSGCFCFGSYNASVHDLVAPIS